jgi:hypothetical protein
MHAGILDTPPLEGGGGGVRKGVDGVSTDGLIVFVR